MISLLKIHRLAHIEEARAVNRLKNRRKTGIDFMRRIGQKRGSGFFRHKKDEPRPVPIPYPDEGKVYSKEIISAAEIEFFGLSRFEKHILAKKARIEGLAYAFLRGVPYECVEVSTHSDLGAFVESQENEEKQKDRIFDRVKACAKFYSPHGDREFEQHWAEWFDLAKDYLIAQAVKKKAIDEELLDEVKKVKGPSEAEVVTI